MKMEMLGSAAAGFFGVSGAILVQHGTNWPAVVAALVGAVLAVLELEDFKVRLAVVVLIFNGVIGALGGPFVAHLLAQRFDLVHPAIFVLLSFVVAYVGHDAFSSLKGPMVQRLAAMLKGGGK